MTVPVEKKIIIAGPVGSGKTTFVNNLTTESAFSTEEYSSEDIGKEKTTVAMDYGIFEVAGHRFQLFGTPGQERFSYMWEILADGALGLILLIPAHRPQHFSKARVIYDKILSKYPLTVVTGVSHTDADQAWEIDSIANFFKFSKETVHAVDPRDRKSSLRLVQTLFKQIKAESQPASA